MTEPCKFEESIILLKDNIPKIEKQLKELTNAILGVNDTKPGLIHKVLTNEKAISKSWWVMGIIAGILISGWVKLMFFE